MCVCVCVWGGGGGGGRGGMRGGGGASLWDTTVCTCVPCYVKCAESMRHCPHAHKNDFNGGANHITNYPHLIFESY